MSETRLSISVVVYRTPLMQLNPLFTSLTALAYAAICVVDNGNDTQLRDYVNRQGWQYLCTGVNHGYGKGHNLALSALHDVDTPYHLVVNPDISFDAGSMLRMLEYLDTHPEVGQLMPRIEYPDGRLQHLCKLLPTPLDLLFRRFLPDCALKRKLRDRYELRYWSYASPADIPVLSGCFMLLRWDALQQCGGFDPRYFMYLEDTDLCRRIGMQWSTCYFPDATAVHDYAKGSYRNPRLLAYHIMSAIRYFNRWGWFRDTYRRIRNKRAEHDLGL